MKRVFDIALPLMIAALFLGAWEWAVAHWQVPPYVLPAPSAIARAFADNFSSLMEALVSTLSVTMEAFVAATVLGVAAAIAFTQSRLLERTLYPYAVILQVTPIVAIAPLLLIYLPQPLAVLACAWIVAFFPVLANTTLGLHSVDRNLGDLFTLYGASRGQLLWYLKLPSALPYIIGGLRIDGGLSLIGAVVADIAAGVRVVKLGAHGIEVNGTPHPALPVDVVDTTGAGDALAAGFLVGGAELARDAAARCVARLGAMP